MISNITIEYIAREAEVSTATVSRYLNSPEKVAFQTAERIKKVIQKYNYQPGKKNRSNVVTVNDVAELAGVSKATVSRVLNNSNLVGEDTRKAVLEAIEELNFLPNMVARQLRKQATKLIGIILPDISNSFYSKVLKGIEEIAYNLEYDVVLMNTNYSEEREAKYLQTLMERRAQGFCFMCHRLDENKIKMLESLPLPYVLISRSVANYPQIPFVNIDNVSGSYDATKHLISLGHKKIAIIAGPPYDECSSLDRIEGYKKALEEANLLFRDDYLKLGDFTFATAEKVARELLELPDRPTAIFAISDETAIGAIKAANGLGYRIPEDISIMGFDNLEIASFYHPTISTIAQPMVEMGKKSAQILINIIEKRKDNEIQLILPHKLVIRESTLRYKV